MFVDIKGWSIYTVNLAYNNAVFSQVILITADRHACNKSLIYKCIIFIKKKKRCFYLHMYNGEHFAGTLLTAMPTWHLGFKNILPLFNPNKQFWITHYETKWPTAVSAHVFFFCPHTQVMCGENYQNWIFKEAFKMTTNDQYPVGLLF